MILNEDYFKDLEIENDDIIEDDVEEPEQEEHELTLEDTYKLPDQYSHFIEIIVKRWDETTSFLTSPLPKLFKRLDAIFESYGIEHSEYVLASEYDMEDCDTVVEFGNYQLFCKECDKDKYINETYYSFNIYVYVNYPKFNYKRAFRFVYAILNIFNIDNHF